MLNAPERKDLLGFENLVGFVLLIYGYKKSPHRPPQVGWGFTLAMSERASTNARHDLLRLCGRRWHYAERAR